MKNLSKKAVAATILSIVVNVVLAVIKFLAGFFGNSYALIADAIESTSDIFASALVLVGIRYAQKPADENHPYGHGKAEPLITFVVVGFLVASATVIGYASIENILTPHKVPEPYTLVVLAVVIITKEAFYRFIKKRGKEIQSTALQADAWHHRSDALTSLTAFVGISIALIFGEGYETADDWAALTAAGFILFNAFLIFRPALSEVMDEHRYDDLVAQIREKAEQISGVISTEKCLVRKAGMYFHVDLHLIVSGGISVRKGHEIAHRVKDHLQAKLPLIADVLIHIEPNE